MPSVSLEEVNFTLGAGEGTGLGVGVAATWIVVGVGAEVGVSSPESAQAAIATISTTAKTINPADLASQRFSSGIKSCRQRLPTVLVRKDELLSYRG